MTGFFFSADIVPPKKYACCGKKSPVPEGPEPATILDYNCKSREPWRGPNDNHKTPSPGKEEKYYDNPQPKE